MSSLVVDSVSKEYRSDGYSITVLDDLSFEAAPGELVVLLGPSGSGKTTLLSCLGAMLSPTSGRISLGDLEITSLSAADRNLYRRSKVGFVFQGFNLIPSLTARENVAVPLLASGISRRAALRAADALMERVGLADRGHHKPTKLSGGQQQRVAVARGLVTDPPLLIADEPTANLDHIQAEAVIELLRELRAQGRVIVVSTHDARLVPIADRVVRMTPEGAETDAGIAAVAFPAGATVFRQGTHADLVYVIDSGRIEIVRELADGGEERLAELACGQYFGELGAVLGFPRSATARAVDACELTALSPNEFRHRFESVAR